MVGVADREMKGRNYFCLPSPSALPACGGVREDQAYHSFAAYIVAGVQAMQRQESFSSSRGAFDGATASTVRINAVTVANVPPLTSILAQGLGQVETLLHVCMCGVVCNRAAVHLGRCWSTDVANCRAAGHSGRRSPGNDCLCGSNRCSNQQVDLRFGSETDPARVRRQPLAFLACFAMVLVDRCFPGSCSCWAFC